MQDMKFLFVCIYSHKMGILISGTSVTIQIYLMLLWLCHTIMLVRSLENYDHWNLLLWHLKFLSSAWLYQQKYYFYPYNMLSLGKKDRISFIDARQCFASVSVYS